MKYQNKGYYTSDLLEKQGIHHGFGTKHFKLTAVRPEPVEGGVICFPKTKQVHGTEVTFLNEVKKDHLYIADAWLTDKPGIICYVRTADCLPLLIYDKKNNIGGAIHCGWRSVAGHIVKKALTELFKRGSKPEDILAVIGPRIRKNCYSVGDELVDGFKNNGWSNSELISNKDGKRYFSVATAVNQELKECGIKKDQTDSINLCTYCHPDKFYSYRKNREEKGRLINFISMR